MTGLSVSLATDESIMETLRNLAHPLRKTDRLAEDLSQDAVKTNDHEAPITKPFSAMSMEDLLKCLPSLCEPTISGMWVPAMQAQVRNVKDLLQEASQMKLNANLDHVGVESVRLPSVSPALVTPTNLLQDLANFSHDVRIITTAYHDVLKSAQSLAERDTRSNLDRVKDLERQLEHVQAKMERGEITLNEQRQKIIQLRQTILEVVRVLGLFIRANLARQSTLVQDPQTQHVFRILADYSLGDNTSLPFVRIPECTIDQYAADLRQANSRVAEYTRVVQSQNTTITEQSRQLDQYLEKFEGLVSRMKERDHEVLLLVQQNEDLDQKLSECETGLSQARNMSAELDMKTRQYEELRGRMESLNIAHTLELDRRDAEIATLRQQLGSVREDVTYQRTDANKVSTQNHFSAARNGPLPPKNSSASKALRFLGMERDKTRFRRHGLPTSRSAVVLSPASAEFSINAPDMRHASKAVTSAEKHAPQPPRRNDAHPIRGDSRTIDIRPRAESLGATERHGIKEGVGDIAKSLPSLPVKALPSELSCDLQPLPLASPMAQQIASDFYDHGIYGQIAPRRVLSDIPEASLRSPSGSGGSVVMVAAPENDDNSIAREGNGVRGNSVDGGAGDADDSISVGSSDRELFRKSIHALDLLATPNRASSNQAQAETGFSNPKDEGTGKYTVHDQVNLLTNSLDDSQRDPLQNLRTQAKHENLRATLRRDDGHTDATGPTSSSTFWSRKKRESGMSDASGYRSSDSDLEPLTVAQLYHSKPWHMRG